MRFDRRNFLGCAAASAALLGHTGALASHDATDGGDGVRWIQLHNRHKVWTQRIGKGPIKVLLLHGGPGFSHDYLQCFTDFLPPAGYELYFYDQLGCGQSDRPSDPSLWTLPRYLQEVEEVRAALGLDRFVLYGHSWGGILGIEYALRHGQHLSAFVLSNMTASIPDYVAYVNHLRGTLPQAAREKLDQLEAAGQVGSPAFNEIVERELYSRYILRIKPWPAPVMRSFEVVNAAIYNQMQGANEFLFTGNLRDWDRWAHLPKIDTKTFVMGAAHCTMNPKSIEREARLLPNAKLFMSEKGSHLAMWDDQNNYFRALLAFLGSLQA